MRTIRLLALVIVGAACGGDPPPCREMIQKLANLCSYSPEQTQTANLGFCQVCSADGQDRWSSCVDEAESCAEARSCGCSQ